MVTMIERLQDDLIETELRRILQQGDLRTVFQPIVYLLDGSIFGYEALSRGPVGSALESPLLLFDAADQVGLTWELDYACRHRAIDRFAIDQYPSPVRDSRQRHGHLRYYG